MAASQLINHVYAAHIENYGTATHSFVFKNPSAAKGVPKRIDVFVWNANEERDTATLSTIGMSDEPMQGVEHRAELHFSIRKRLSDEEMEQLSLFMANLAMLPFVGGSHFDWWHTISQPNGIPLFNSASSVWLHPPFVDGGWAKIEMPSIEIPGLEMLGIETPGIKPPDAEVRILNVVPITDSELKITDLEKRIAALEGVDIFSPR